MNYQKHYLALCEKRKTLPSQAGYTEVHHVLPKCLGGTNESANLVRLSAREHFLAHWLLSRIYPEHLGIQLAFKMMCDVDASRRNLRYTPSSRVVAEAREKVAILTKKKLTGKSKVDLYGEEKAKTILKKISETKTGVPLSTETKIKIKKALTGRDRVEMKGRMHINNGSVGKMIFKEELEAYLSLGWEPGRLPESKNTAEKRKASCANRIWVHNEKKEVLINLTKVFIFMEQGYIRGRLTRK